MPPHILRTIRFAFFSLIAVGLQPVGQSQDWVKSMFSETQHDFGTVPRGAKSEFRFLVTNKYEEDVHIASVRSSCNCTSPRIENADLKTYEQGAVVCEFNTRSFIGKKAAVVTVVFDKPFYGEMQLMVTGNIRSDIVTEPGQIQFGEVDRGATRETSVAISHAGSSRWAIQDVQSTNQDLSVKLDGPMSQSGGVRYEMRVRLKDTAPAGEFNDEIVLVTNDPQFNLVTIPVRGKVLPPLITSPVLLGTIRVGNSVDSSLIVRSKSPFKIEDVRCEDKRLTLQTPIAIAGGRAYRIPFEFEAAKPIGAFKQPIVIRTSLEQDGVAKTIVSGNVAK